MEYQEVLNFWFKDLTPKDQFAKNPELDKKMSRMFSQTLSAARSGELYTWRATPEGRLAEIIVLDQFSRNIYRDRPESFAGDGMALILAQEIVGRGLDQKISLPQRVFVYIPMMHSESAAIHQLAVGYFGQKGMESNYEFELRHKAIIDRFGRFPHRNAILGRTSTPEEIEFLQQPGSSF